MAFLFKTFTAFQFAIAADSIFQPLRTISVTFLDEQAEQPPWNRGCGDDDDSMNLMMIIIRHPNRGIRNGTSIDTSLRFWRPGNFTTSGRYLLCRGVVALRAWDVHYRHEFAGVSLFRTYV